jgi:hypothetical protein
VTAAKTTVPAAQACRGMTGRMPSEPVSAWHNCILPSVDLQQGMPKLHIPSVTRLIKSVHDRGRVYRANYEDCRAEASKATSASSKAQWLLFAEEWLKQAEAAEAQHRRDAATAAVPAKRARPGDLQAARQQARPLIRAL